MSESGTMFSILTVPTGDSPMRSRMVVLAVLGAGLALGGCSKSHEPQSKACVSCANDEVTLGSTAMANGDYAAAHDHYVRAAGHDPANRKAQAGAALTEIFMIQEDPEVLRIAGTLAPTPRPATPSLGRGDARFSLLKSGSGADFGPHALSLRMIRAFSLAAHDPTAVSDAQNVIKTRVMPRLQDAESRLNVVESDPNFSYPVTIMVGTNTVTIEIDRGEIFTLDAMVNAAQGMLGLLVAYNFDVPNSDFVNLPADSLLAPGTAFGRLHPDGASQLSASLANLRLVRGRFDQAVSSILAETDDQSDDVLPQEALQWPEFINLQTQINNVDAMLSGPIAFEFTDYLGNPFPAQLNAGRFFVPGIADFKTKLPAHTFNTLREFVLTPPLTFPDPAFNGIFPDMTNARWQALVGPVAAPRLIAGR